MYKVLLTQHPKYSTSNQANLSFFKSVLCRVSAVRAPYSSLFLFLLLASLAVLAVVALVVFGIN